MNNLQTNNFEIGMYQLGTMLISVFINFTFIFKGVNLSIADVLMLTTVLYLLLNNRLIFPKKTTIFLLVYFGIILTSTVHTVFSLSSINFSTSDFILDIIKFLVSLMYLIIGYNSANYFDSKFLLKIYSYTSYIIGIVGLLFYFLNINYLKNTLFFANIRLQGFMSDPNFYAIVQNSAFIIMIKDKKLGNFKKSLALIINFFIIVLTGSKTGFLTFLMIILLSIFDKILNKKIKIKLNNLVVLVVILFSVFFISFNPLFIKLIDKIQEVFPIFSRVVDVFKAESINIGSGGSNRDVTFIEAIKISLIWPVIGVGFGTYKSISYHYFGNSLVAHNTYLQLLAEWGYILTAIFFSVVFKMVFRRKKTNNIYIIIAYSILVFLIGSVSISLNNARMFWYLLGMLLCHNEKVIKKDSDEERKYIKICSIQ